MASPRLLYYAERAALQSPRTAPPEDHPLAPAQGVANSVRMGLAVWVAIGLLFLLVVYR